MDNATFRANMENAVNAAHVKCSCAKDAIEDAIDRLVEANNILRYVTNRL